MKDKTYHTYLDSHERQIVIHSLVELKNKLIQHYFDLGLTYEQIGVMEGCTKIPIKRSIDKAIEKIRLALKNF